MMNVNSPVQRYHSVIHYAFLAMFPPQYVTSTFVQLPKTRLRYGSHQDTVFLN